MQYKCFNEINFNFHIDNVIVFWNSIISLPGFRFQNKGNVTRKKSLPFHNYIQFWVNTGHVQKLSNEIKPYGHWKDSPELCYVRPIAYRPKISKDVRISYFWPSEDGLMYEILYLLDLTTYYWCYYYYIWLLVLYTQIRKRQFCLFLAHFGHHME